MFPILYCLLFLATGNIEIDSAPPNYGDEFGSIIKKASIRLQGAAQKRPLKLKGWNASLSKTAKAARILASKGGDYEEAIRDLEAARADYAGNSFSYLLEAVIRSTQGKKEEANKMFEQFLLQSRTFTKFEESFLHWGEFHTLRRSVYELLKARGITFEGREKDIQVVVPYQEFFKYVMSPGREDWVMNLSFIFLIIGGGVLLIIASLAGVDFYKSIPGNFIVMYLAVWIAYGLWIFDLAFGLPWGLSRFSAIPVFLLSCVVSLAALEYWAYWREHKRPLEPGYRKCPHCGAVILKLATECSQCRRKL